MVIRQCVVCDREFVTRCFRCGNPKTCSDKCSAENYSAKKSRWLEANQEAINEWRLRNRERTRVAAAKASREDRLRNRDALNEQSRNNYRLNREARLEYQLRRDRKSRDALRTLKHLGIDITGITPSVALATLKNLGVKL